MIPQDNKYVREVESILIADTEKMWQSVDGVVTSDKLRQLLLNGGVKFFDDEANFLNRPVVAIAGVGGLPFSFGGGSVLPATASTLEAVKLGTAQTMGSAAAFSYLNPKDNDLGQVYKNVTGMGHFSIAHTTTVNLLFLGTSAGAEIEFNSQRDLVHLARLTVARTKAQNHPPVIVLDPEHLQFAQDIYSRTREAIEASRPVSPTKFHLESFNLMYPTAKASMFMITSSLRNLQKLVSQIGDGGKEDEYQRLLYLMNDQLHAIWPELFKLVPEDTFTLPSHWN